MLIAIHDLRYKPRYVIEIRDTFELHKRELTPEDLDHDDNGLYLVSLSNAAITTIGDRIVVITSLTHPERAGIFISVIDFSTIEIC